MNRKSFHSVVFRWGFNLKPIHLWYNVKGSRNQWTDSNNIQPLSTNLNQLSFEDAIDNLIDYRNSEIIVNFLPFKPFSHIPNA